jgi:sec-independent protein translocase protein TatC
MPDHLESVLSSPELQEKINRYFPYLVEIRKRLLFLASLFLIAAGVGFFNYEKIVTLVLKFLELKGVNIVFTSPFQFFTLAVNSGMFVGLLAIFPFIVHQVVSFLKPALSKKEYRLVVAPLPISIFLLALGFVYGIYVMKYVVAIFYQKSVDLQIGNILDVELLLSKIVMTGLLMGLAFQFPIVMSILLHLKVFTLKAIKSQRPLAYAGAMLFVMLLPPTDIFSDILL